MAEKDPSLSQGRGLSNSQRSDKKEKKKEKKEKKPKKLKKDKSKELQPPGGDPPKKKVLIADPGSGAPEPPTSSSPTPDSRVNVSPVTPFSSVKEPEPGARSGPSSPGSTDGKAARGSLSSGPSLTLPDENAARPSPPQSPASPARRLSFADRTPIAHAAPSVADMIEKEAQASLTRSQMRQPSGNSRGSAPGGAATPVSSLPASPSGSTVITQSPKSRRTPSLTRADQILPGNSGSLRRQVSDPDIQAVKAEAEHKQKEKEKEKEKEKAAQKEKDKSVKRFSRFIGGLAPVTADSDTRLEIPDFVGTLVINLIDAHGLRPSAEYDDLMVSETNPFCLFRVGEQESRSLVASRSGCAWNEYLNVMCDESSTTLTLDVFDYIGMGREAIIGSASVELKHLYLGGFSDEWSEFSLRVDKESNAIVNFRCCFKPFVGQAREKPRDMFGFEIPSDKVLKLYKEITPLKLKQDLERHRSLNRMYNWQRPKDVKDLKKYTRRGIPIAHRPEVWLIATGAKKKMEAHAGLYQKLLQENITRTSAHTIQIDKDLHRTAGNHHLYRTVEGRSALRRILVAYSWKNAGLGYCQSMNFIGAILLLFLAEEAVFWLLATIVEDLLPDYFTRDMHGVKADVLVFKELVREKLPRLMTHFQRLDYNLGMVVQPWFLCLFTTYLPTHTLLRVYDAFVMEGSKTLFRVGLALLKLNEDALLAARNEDEVHSLLKEIPSTCFDSERLVKVAYKDFGSSLFNSSIVGKLKLFREKELKKYQENLKADDFRSLGGTTKFDQNNLEALHQQFRAVAQKKMDGNEDASYLTLEAFEALMFGSLEDRTPTALYLFRAFDTRRDEVVDFREFANGLHVMTKGTPDEKIHFFFMAFDDDNDGYLTADQLAQLMNMQFLVLKQNDLTPSQKQLIVKNLVAKSATGKLSFPEFRAAISEVSLLEAALQLASTAADPNSPTTAHIPTPAAAQQPSQLSLSGAHSSGERIPHLDPAPQEGVVKTPSSPVDSSVLTGSRQRKNSTSRASGMRRSRSQAELNQLEKKATPTTRNEQGEVVVANPLWRKPGGSLLPTVPKRDTVHPVPPRLSEAGRPLEVGGRTSNSGALKSSDDGARSPRTSPRGGGATTERTTLRRLEWSTAPLSKSKSEAKDGKGRVSKHGQPGGGELFSFEPLASLDHLTIDLSHLSRDARLRASRDLFGAKTIQPQQPVSVAVSTSTASSGLRTSDKALAQSAAEALRTSKGLRSSDSALHASTRNIAAVVHQATQLRASRSSEDLRKGVIEAGVIPPATPPKDDLPPSVSAEMAPSQAPKEIRDSPARDGLPASQPSRPNRSGSDVLGGPRLTENKSSGSSPDSSGQTSPHGPSPARLHQRRSSAGATPSLRSIKKDSDEQHPIGRDSSGELKRSKKNTK